MRTPDIKTFIELFEKDFLKEPWDIVPNEKLPAEAYHLPEIFVIEMNPRYIKTIDDFYFVLAHEVVHWVFPDLSSVHADNIAAEVFTNPKFRRLVRENLGIPDWIINKEGE